MRRLCLAQGRRKGRDATRRAGSGLDGTQGQRAQCHFLHPLQHERLGGAENGAQLRHHGPLYRTGFVVDRDVDCQYRRRAERFMDFAHGNAVDGARERPAATGAAVRRDQAGQLERHHRASHHHRVRSKHLRDRNLDRNWQLQASLEGLRVEVPALFAVGARDAGLAMPGMDHIIAAMPALVPRLRPPVTVDDAGHWLQQERPDTVNGLILSFGASLLD